jgi:hypothetical protein
MIYKFYRQLFFLIIAAGFIITLTVYLAPLTDGGFVQMGWQQSILNLPCLLSLIGLGLALAPLPSFLRPGFALILFVIATIGGWLETSNILSAFLPLIGARHFINMIGPFICMLSGLALLCPTQVWRFLFPLLSFLLGAGFGLFIGLNTPRGTGEIIFALSAEAAGLWVLVSSFTLRKLCQKPWLDVVDKIFGSWLLAGGILLIGLAQFSRPLML